MDSTKGKMQKKYTFASVATAAGTGVSAGTAGGSGTAEEAVNLHWLRHSDPAILVLSPLTTFHHPLFVR